MLYTVSFSRLDLFFAGKVAGKRQYVYPFVSKEDMQAVWKCVMYGLGRADVLTGQPVKEKTKVLLEEETIVRKTKIVRTSLPSGLDFGTNHS